MKTYFVYIMANDARTTYVGVTNDLERRVREHRNGRTPSSFSARHGIAKLVYMEDFEDIHDAIAREKQIKNWRRSKKVAIINELNPGWDDLAAGRYSDDRAGLCPEISRSW